MPGIYSPIGEPIIFVSERAHKNVATTREPQQAVFTGGGQVGANYQFNWFVVGIGWQTTIIQAMRLPLRLVPFNFLPTTDG